MEVCKGEILYAAAYGGMYDCTFTSSVTATPVWLETVKEHGYAVCETNDTLWLDFDLNSGDVFDVADDSGIDPYLSFARKYCYKRFCENYCGYFGMIEIFGFLYRAFSPKYKEPADAYDQAYVEFVDSLLDDVRFVVCLKMANSSLEVMAGKRVDGSVNDAPIEGTRTMESESANPVGVERENKAKRSQIAGRSLSRASSAFSFDIDDQNYEEEFTEFPDIVFK